MASSNSISIHILCFLLCLTLVASESKPSLKPNKFLLPVRKDTATGLHLAYIHQRTPSLQLPVILDLNARSLWVNCPKTYHSSSYTALVCHSTSCSRVGANSCITCPGTTVGPGCHKNSCGVVITNPVTGVDIMSELSQDALSIHSTQSQIYTVSSFLFVCPLLSDFQKGMPKSAAGVAGLARSPLSLQAQLASRFAFPQKFAICLSPSASQSGVIFFGDGPYTTAGGVDLAPTAVSSATPLTVTSNGEYRVGLKSIMINNKAVPLNKTLLLGGGTKISTTAPYSVLEHSIYEAVRRSFAEEMAAAGLKEARAVAPFGLCYEARKVGSTRAGVRPPVVDLAMEKQNAAWRVVGANSMVEARKGVTCLGLVDGGSAEKMGAAVVVGAKQMEDNLVVFDVGRSTVGFSSWLPGHLSSCAAFNFTAQS